MSIHSTYNSVPAVHFARGVYFKFWSSMRSLTDTWNLGLTSEICRPRPRWILCDPSVNDFNIDRRYAYEGRTHTTTL